MGKAVTLHGLLVFNPVPSLTPSTHFEKSEKYFPQPVISSSSSLLHFERAVIAVSIDFPSKGVLFVIDVVCKLTLKKRAIFLSPTGVTQGETEDPLSAWEPFISPQHDV